MVGLGRSDAGERRSASAYGGSEIASEFIRKRSGILVSCIPPRFHGRSTQYLVPYIRTNINNCVLSQLLSIYINDIFTILLTVHK